MKKSDFYYELPDELIAQEPIEPRDHSRLLVYNKFDTSVAHKKFYDILDYLNSGDVLVVNNTRVLPARIYGTKESGARLEFLLHKQISNTVWECLVKPSKRARVGDKFFFCDKLSGVIKEEMQHGARLVDFSFTGDFLDILGEIGTAPLPHYIKQDLKKLDRYQTVYAKDAGSVAAPTAGLHFTESLLEKIKEKGVEIVEILLHVGIGTFRPVSADNILDHKMHSEYYEVSKSAADKINLAKSKNKKVVAVGTTSVRTLETVSDSNGKIRPQSGDTSVFIYPGYKYKAIDAIITNFHLPESTLIMLVSAFIGRTETLRVYETAVKERYRFFSFGDACLFYKCKM